MLIHLSGLLAHQILLFNLFILLIDSFSQNPEIRRWVLFGHNVVRVLFCDVSRFTGQRSLISHAIPLRIDIIGFLPAIKILILSRSMSTDFGRSLSLQRLSGLIVWIDLDLVLFHLDDLREIVVFFLASCSFKLIVVIDDVSGALIYISTIKSIMGNLRIHNTATISIFTLILR